MGAHSNAVFGTPELLSHVLSFDTTGVARAVCREWALEWRRQHETHTFTYELLEKRRDVRHARVVGALRQGRAIDVHP